LISINEHNVVHLSVNSSYFCNFSCKYCYLTPEQLKDKKLLPLEVLDARLNEIVQGGYKLGHADVYGGEVMLYPKGYVQELKSLLNDYGINEIEIITNLSAYNPDIVEDPDFGISVSYDFEHREKSDIVYANLLKLQRPYTILTLAIPEVVKMDVSWILNWLSTLKHLMAWEVKPYSINQANAAKVSNRDFEQFIQSIISSPIQKHFEFLNESVLRQAIAMQRNAFSDDHVYITPSGNFGVLEFDLNDREYFLELENFDKYIEWTLEEKNRVYSNDHCSSCEYLGKCISEHLRPVKNMDDSCNGYRNLIRWSVENLK